jgi:hypothetical protein
MTTTYPYLLQYMSRPAPGTSRGWHEAWDKIRQALDLVPKNERLLLVVQTLVQETIRDALDDPGQYHLEHIVAEAEEVAEAWEADEAAGPEHGGSDA